MSATGLRGKIPVRVSVACMVSVLTLAFPAASNALAQGTAPSELVACPVPSGVRIRAATYVALGKDLLFRLLVERSSDDALLLMNKVDGNRLYDRTYWKPAKVTENCGQRIVDYVGEEAQPGAPAQTLRLVLEPAETIRRPGLPRPMVIFAAVVVLPSGDRQSLQFEEVVIRREVGGK
jgi:hypothetical protein